MIRVAKHVQISRAVDFIEVSHSGDTHRILLRRVAGARRFTLRVRAASRDVVLSMPLRAKVDEAHKFAAQHAAWIGARIKRLPEPVPFAEGSVIPLRGIEHTIRHMPSMRGTVWTGDASSCSGDCEPILYVAGDSSHVERRVDDYLRKQAKLDLMAAVGRHCAQLGVRPSRVSLRDTSSRWGSCSSNGNLNFSWRLILAPAFVLDYLAAHEVAHLRHLNHSARFWKLARELCPDTDIAEAWLSAHGTHLHRYGKSI
ncbi:MAG: M48 family metallopeptidase [Beijerinckiaceae bacterium]